MQRSWFQTTLGVIFLILIEGCLKSPKGAELNSSSQIPGSNKFVGAISAENISDTQIKIKWNSLEQENFLTYQIYQLGTDGSLVSLASVSKTVTQYVASGLTPGTFYSFVVRATDNNNQTDTNNNFVSALTYAGVTSSTVLGGTSANIVYPSAPSAQNINIYCAVGASVNFSFMATTSSNSTNYTLNGLTKDTLYTCKVLAVAPNGVEDSNVVTTSFTPKTGLIFDGALSATNISDSQIKIQWNSLTHPELVNFRIFRLNADASLTSLATVAKTQTQYVVSGLSPGTFHSYIVKALDSKGDLDSNTKFVSAITYGGVISSAYQSATTATIVFPSAPDASGINIYCYTGSSENYTLFATVSSLLSSQLLTGLTTNVTYTCKVLATAPNGIEDSNTVTTSFTPVAGSPPPDLTFGGLSYIYSNPTGTQLVLNWTLGTGVDIQNYEIVRVNDDNSLTVVETVPKTQYSYTLTGLAPLSVYKYVVHALSSSGIADTNNIQRKGFTYPGTSSSVITDNTINFPATGDKVTGVDIYCKLKTDSNYVYMLRISSTTATSALITGLTNNRAYDCRANPFLDSYTFTSTSTATVYSKYTGISGTTDSISQTSATVYFSGVSGITGANGVKIYCKPSSSSSYSGSPNATIVSTTAISATLTGLPSGRTLTCKAVAYVGATLIDNSTTTTTFQTLSNSYYPLASPKYNGVILVQAFGDASTVYVLGMQKTKKVLINWKYFGSTSTTSQTYVLVRTSAGAPIDMTTSISCTPTTTTSCRVCVVTGADSQYCADTNVGGPPNKYDYVVALQSSDGVSEELPSGQSDAPYRITVPIPPNNMSLVHRDSVNYKMCSLLGKVSDPLNHQRCAYSGLGAVPYNSNPGSAALNLPTNFYDFGYNLFVDRWEAACNWTLTSPTTPTGSEGADGDVLFQLDNTQCRIKIGGVWRALNSTGVTITDAHRSAVYTNAPSSSYHKPPLTQLNQVDSYKACQAISDPYYGKKRLLRKREFIAASAWATISGEYGAITDTSATGVESGSDHSITAGTFRCAGDYASGITVTSFNTSGYELVRDITNPSNSYAFTIGSQGTKNCVSRFGLQDMIGNVAEYVSDQLGSCDSTTHTCSGISSTLDEGNRDLNGFSFDGSQAPGGGSSAITNWTYELFSLAPIGSNNYTSMYFSTPLGLPILTSDGGNALSIGPEIDTNKLHVDRIDLNTDSANDASVARAVRVGGGYGLGNGGGRWYSDYTPRPITSTSQSTGFRCALPAE